MKNAHWDFSQYNAVVKQVERCSDVLYRSAHEIRPYVNSRTSIRLLKHLESAVSDLDKRALRMLAIYDPAARAMIHRGESYDPRRDLIKADYERRISPPKKRSRQK